MHNFKHLISLRYFRKECGLPILISSPHATLVNMQLHGITSSILCHPCWLTMSYYFSVPKTLEPKGSWISKPFLTFCCIWNSLFSPCSTCLILWCLIWSAFLHHGILTAANTDPAGSKLLKILPFDSHVLCCDLPKILPDCLKLECCNQILLWHKENLNCRCRLWFTTYNINFLTRWGLSAPDSLSENAEVSYDHVCVY